MDESTSAERHVKGELFVDYVRMLRRFKGIDWSTRFRGDALRWLNDRIDAEAWYPMGVFEQYGEAILAFVAQGDLELVRQFGRSTAAPLAVANPMLVAPGDAVETLARFRVLRASYFDFDALSIPSLYDGEAEVVIDYRMGAIAEEAAAWQTLGFFEGQLELCGAADVGSRFVTRKWAGDDRTLVHLSWRG
jgi:hypothetical protein